MPTTLPVLTAAWIALLVIPAAVTDARRGVIPNWLTLPTLAAAPLVAWSLAGGAALATSLAGALVCGLVPLLLFRAGAGGGGDVKLLAALGAVAGARLGLEIQFASFVLATLWALATLARRGGLAATFARSLALVAHPFLPRRQRDQLPVDANAMTSVRLGPAILAGSLAVLASQATRWP